MRLQRTMEPGIPKSLGRSWSFALLSLRLSGIWKGKRRVEASIHAPPGLTGR